MKPEEALNVWMEDQKGEKLLLGSISLQSKINLFKMLEKEERKKASSYSIWQEMVPYY